MKEKELIDPYTMAVLGMVVGSEVVDIAQRDGQTTLKNTHQLPSRMSDLTRQAFTAAGVVFGDKVDGDELFVHAILPHGWKKVPTDHSMYTNIVDANGHIRGSIMYKSSFYDRDASLSVRPRFSATYTNDKWIDPTAPDCDVPVIMDGKTVVWRGKPIPKASEWRDGKPPTWDVHNHNDSGRYYYSSHQHASHIANQVLMMYCPEYRGDGIQRMLAYWDANIKWPKWLSQEPIGDDYEVSTSIYDNAGSGQYRYVDGGTHATVRATDHNSAWDKALSVTERIRDTYDKVTVDVCLGGKTIRSESFEKRRSSLIDIGNGMCEYWPYSSKGTD